MLEGLTNAAVAAATGLAEQTVKNVLHGVFRKLGVRRRMEPLSGSPCGYSVDAPLVTFVPHHLDPHELLLARGGDDLWIVLSYVEDSASAELLRVASCP